MIYSVTQKSSGATTKAHDSKVIALDAASVVTLGFGPEEVARFDKVGNNLVLVLSDGTRVTILNFFVTYEDGRNEIVFVDENDVVWWGQYAEPWSSFQIAEIEQGLVPAAAGFAGLAPFLGVVGAAALAGAGGSSEPSPVDPDPNAADDTARVVEAGVADGANEDAPGIPEVEGNVLANDGGSDTSALNVVAVGTGSSIGSVGTPLQGLYGSLTLNADGSYVYVLDNSLESTQSLASGDVREETFIYSIVDGSGASSSATITITVEGTNDIPEVAGVVEGTVEEDGVQTFSAQLDVSDVDAGDMHTWSVADSGAGSYGTFSVNETGTWTYVLDNDLAAVQGLADGETLTDTITIRATDTLGAFDDQEVTVTITGSNDTPVIDEDTSVTSAEVSEITDGAPGENSDVIVTSGTIDFSDPDGQTDQVTITAEPVIDDGSYLGNLTIVPDVSGVIDWTFTVDDSVLDGLPKGQVITQEYVVTLTDPNGATTTETVTITLTGTNDSPVAQDDASIITPGETASLDVLANDTDADNGETGTLIVTQVDGQPITVGTPVTLSDGSGTVSLTDRGTLSFVPADGFTGEVVIPYVTDDGSGPDNATGGAAWVVNVVNASITDNASLLDPDIPDGVIASIDEVERVVIEGQIPPGGIVTGITVTDGVNTVTVPTDTIVVDTDGGFTTTTDLTGLDDGTLTLELSFEDENGETVTSTDTIEKDTATTVSIDPIDAGDGTPPTITGTGEPGDTLVLTIDGGDPIPLVVGDDGTWRHTPDDPLPSPEVDVTIEATDPFGNTATDERDVIQLDVQDQEPGAPEDISVSEAGLSDGSDPSSGSDSINGTLTIGTSDGDISAVSIGGTSISIDQLDNIGTMPIPPIATTYGGITITGYDAGTGVITYTYDLDDNTTTHMNAPGVDAERDIVREAIPVSVTDADGDTRSTTLSVAIVDDIPTIGVVTASTVSLEASDATLGTNPSASFAGLFDINHGADGPAAADGTTYNLEVSSPASGLIDGETGSPIVLTLESGAIVGRVEGSEEIAFSVSVDPTSGQVTLDQQRVLSHPNGSTADAVSLGAAAVQLRATATDGDGDTVSEVANIGDRITFSDSVPNAVNDVANVPVGSTDAISGNVIAGDGATGADDLGADSPALLTGVVGSGDQVAVPADGNVVIPGTYGDLTIAADGSYSYTRNENTPGDAIEVFTYTLTDNDGDTETATLTITFGDAPVSITGLVDEASGGDADVNESKLPDGTDVGDGDDATTGSFTISAFDGIADLSISQGANTLTVITNDVLQSGPLTLTTALGSTLEITGFDANTGEVSYAYSLSDAETHGATGRDDIFEAFGIRLEDLDNDVDTNTLSIRIIDDIPVITAETGVTVSLEADDATLGTDPTASFAGLFTVDHGADGAAATDGTVYSLEVGAAASGLVDGATGDAIVLTLEGGVVVGRVDGSGDVAFRVVLDGVTGAVTLDQQRVISHPDGTSADVVAIAEAAVQMRVTATDGDGDVVSEAVNIGARLTFRDDLPVAEDDTADIAADSTGPATGNVITENDDQGADVASTVTSVTGSGADTPVADTGNTVIAGTYGDLTIAADGTYSYTRNENTPGDVDDVFTYTLTDNDGDTDTATLTVSIADADVTISGLTAQGSGGDAFVNESKLPDGTDVGAGDDAVNGSFTIASFDGIANLSLTQGANTLAIITNDVLQTGPLTLTTALGSTLEITGYNANTGEVSYTYTLSDAETHSGAGRDDIFEAFGITLEDRDGDTDTDTLSIRIVDDVPVITAESGVVVTLEAADATLGTDPSASFAGLFTIDHGADDAAATDGTVYDLLVGATANGLTDGATGDPINLTLESGVVVGRVDGSNEIAFRVLVDDQTGAVTLDQQRVISHPDGTSADVVAITDAAVQLRVTATDADGDVVTETANIGARLTFRDDLPEVTAAVDSGFSVPTLTTQDADTLAGTDTATADFSGALAETADFGADGAAAANSVAWDYSLTLLGAATSVASGLSSEGDAITLYLIGGSVVGSTAASAGAVAAGNTAFTIDLDTDGEITLSQSATIDHASTSSATEVAALAQNLIRLNGTVTITDRDGDTDTASTNLDIGDSFALTDDGPTVGAEVAAPDLTEVNLRANGSTTSVARDLNIDFGADRDDGTLGVAFQSTQTALLALGLTSGGNPVSYVIVGGLLTARANGEDVFTVELAQPTLANSFQTSYEFTLIKPLDHEALGTGTPLANLTLPFAITATDGDGDTADETFDVRIIDDTPTAVAQTGLSVVEGGTAIGTAAGDPNLLTNDTQGADGARVHQVSYTDDAGDTQTVTIVPPATSTTAIDTQYGTLTVGADGSWSYTPDSAVTNPSDAAVDDDFSYSLIDSDGDVSSFVSQPIEVTDTAPVAEDDAAQSAAEGGAALTGNVVTNDRASADGGTLVDSFTYTNAAGASRTFGFTDVITTQTVATPTGSLTVNAVGTWSFTPAASFDHDAAGANSAAGSFSYVLVDADGTTSNSADQPLTVTDTSPTVDAVSFGLDEADLPSIGSAGATGADPSVQQTLDITKDQDDIADVVFTNATIAALPTTLESNGTALSYSISSDGHTLTASAGSGGATVFTLVIGNPNDTTGATQNITATLSEPLDQPAAVSTILNVLYQVQDIDSAVGGSATFTITDDTPAVPLNDTAVTVVEGGAAVGSANTGANLLTNDTLGADGGRVYDFTYTDAAGDAQTSLVTEGGSTTVTTQYGALTVHDDGVWSYTPAATSDHAKPAADTTLSDNFTYRVIDGDNDTSTASATQAISVTDTVATIGTPEGASVDEANLPNGTDPQVAPRTVTGSLNLAAGQDTFVATIINTPMGVTSNGVAVEYVLAGDNQSLIAYAGSGRTASDQVFSVDLTNPTAATAGYSSTLLGALDQGLAASIDLDFGITVTDSDGDTDSDTFTVTVADDASPLNIARTIDEDGSFRVNITADSNTSNTAIFQGGTAVTGVPNGNDVVYQLANGTATVKADGSVLYAAAPNLSGTETFEVQTTDGTVTSSTTVTATVNPISDAPTNTVDAADINTPEDVAVSLGLNAPDITDDGTGTGNNTTSERIGAITLSGIPAGVQLLDGTNSDAALFTSTGADITIVLSDVATVTGTTGTLTLTSAQYEALKVLPPEHDHDNFSVSADVSSFEVDGTGAVIGGVAGAAADTATVDVSVQAVTDDAELIFDSSATSVTNAPTIVYSGAGGNTVATATIQEDARFNLIDILDATFDDLDGSEDRSIVITNGTGQTLSIGGQNVDDGDTATFDAIGQTGSISSFDEIEIGATGNFSGVLNGITIEINAMDEDSDGFWNGTADVAGPVDGIAEADTSNNAVTLNLQVTPTAGDVASGGLDVTTNEDTAVTFLRNIRINDGSSVGGEEVFDSVKFDLPTGWTFTDSTTTNGAAWTVGISGATHTITFTAGTQAEQETALDNFAIMPPRHSSLDVSVNVEVTTTDTNATTGSDTATVTRTVDVTVDPVAEVVGTDTDDDNNDDLTLTPGFTYSTPGSEDEWFDLNSDGFNLAADWSNQDTDEIGAGTDNTYARLTPEIDGGSAVGAQLRWTDTTGQVTQTFTASPIDIPVSALGTVEFLPPPDIAGRFAISIQAYTEDFDDDAEGTESPATAVSGTAELSNLDIAPVADEIALTLNARASGAEDTPIPLNIRPSSSDPSETFNVSIKDIPVGATISYDGTTFTATAGNTTFDITDFDRNAAMTITPPSNSNDDFVLTVEAVTVDSVQIGGSTVTDSFSPPASLSINVAVKGIADPTTIVATSQSYTEASLDSGTTAIELADLVSISLSDNDTSEALTVRISDLRDGFDLSEGSLLTPQSVTGADRIWALNTTQLANAEISGPENFSGAVSFDVQSVTTENDGSSLTSAATAAAFEVTPSPEAGVTESATLIEDVVTSLNFGIAHQNGDTDETIGRVLIATADASTSTYTLYMGTAGSAVELSTATLSSPQNEAGFYVLTAAEAATLAALSSDNLDGALGTFELRYEIIDENFGTEMAATSTTSALQTVDFALTATPVTDAPDATITAISGNLASTTATDAQAGDDANPDTVTLDAADVVEVTLNVSSPDDDGSEHVVRVIVDNVPEGVTVTGGQIIDQNSWLLIYEDVDALPINTAGGTAIPIEFDVGEDVGNLSGTQIDMTVQVQDRGNLGAPGTSILSDTVSWTLSTTFTSAGTGGDPAEITDWSYNNSGATEDVTFMLSDVIDAAVNAQSLAPNTLTVQITDLPPGTVVSGMTQTIINGVVTYTASVTSNQGDDTVAVQALFAAMMDGIEITAPANANDNNNQPDGLTFTANLSTKVVNGTSDNSQTIVPDIPIAPVTDPASLEISVSASDPSGNLEESDPSIPLTISITNAADGAAGSVVDNTLYLQIDGDVPDLENGTLTNAAGTTTYSLTAVSGVTGIPDDNYYVVTGVTMGSQVDVVYTPPTMVAGNLTVDAQILNVETGSTNLNSSQTQVLPIEIANNGVTATSAATSGSEAADTTDASLIQLSGLSVTLEDNDGSEELVSILLTNVPEGFLIYAGPNAAGASPASNAGGDGTVNTWIVSGAGESLPPYVAILPPQNWSGTLDSLEMVMTSGETTLSQALTQTFDIEDITVAPVSDGLVILPTSTFGTEGQIVELNFNISLNDPNDATVTANAADENQETATLELTGLGEYTSFYNDTTLITSGITYDSGTDTYTIAGLTQGQIDALAFKQVIDALTDQDPAARTQIAISGFTMDGSSMSASVTSTLTVNFSEQLATSGNDTLLWSGLAIDAAAGEDTIDFRIDEDLTGADVAANLQNVETLDMSIHGVNVLDDLTPEQLQTITDGDDTLIITGTSDDTVNLDGTWRDLGGGVYNGVIAGVPEVLVTLTVTGGVQVGSPPGGFEPVPPPAAPMAPLVFNLAQPEEDFGLASMERAAEATATPDEADTSASSPLTYDDVLGVMENDSLNALLPVQDNETTPPKADRPAQKSTGGDLLAPATPWEDELLDSAVYEV